MLRNTRKSNEDRSIIRCPWQNGSVSVIADSVFERFNIDRPKDFCGHSLSGSDIVVLNDGEKVEEMDEIVMAEIQKSQGEYKPLAKVEELRNCVSGMLDGNYLS